MQAAKAKTVEQQASVAVARRAQAASKILAQAAVAKAEAAEFKASLDKVKQEQVVRKQQV